MIPTFANRYTITTLHDGGARIDEVENHRGWSVLRAFRDLGECGGCLAEQPEEAAIEFGNG